MRPLRLVHSRAALLGSAAALALGTAASHAVTCSVFSPAVSYSCGASPNGIAMGDFDRDGIVDLAVANGTGAHTLSVLRGKGAGGVGDGTFQAPVGYASAGATPRAIATADLDEDGLLDLLVGVNGSLQIWKGAAGGTFSLRGTVAAGTTPRAIAVGDLDSDGILDVAVFGSGLHVKVEDDQAAQQEIRSALHRAGIEVRSLAPIMPSMEDVFVSLIEKEERLKVKPVEVRA